MSLIYVDPSRFIPGVPCRDLSDDEVDRYGGEEALVASGLYVIVKPPKKQQNNEVKSNG